MTKNDRLLRVCRKCAREIEEYEILYDGGVCAGCLCEEADKISEVLNFGVKFKIEREDLDN